MKLVLVVRTDLKMGKGKIGAQCGHASVGACKKMDRQQERDYERDNTPKIVVKVDSEQKLLDLRDMADRMGLITYLVQDAGHTQVAPGSKTVLAIGPGPDDLINHVTGTLPLL